MSRFTKLQVIALTKIEVYYLCEGQGWETDILFVPVDIAKSNSQDAFIKWYYSEEGQLAVPEKYDLVAVYVMHFRDDIMCDARLAIDVLRVDVLLCRAEDGRWRTFVRGTTDSAREIFQAWDVGETDVTIDADEADYTIYMMEEAELHLVRLGLLQHKSKAQQAEITSLERAIKIASEIEERTSVHAPGCSTVNCDCGIEEPDDEHGLADLHDEGDPTPDDPQI